VSAAYATALEFARCGHAVLPVRGKAPLVGEGGFHRASADPDTLLAWHNRWPTAGWAVVCGHEFVVIDVDVKRGADVQAVLALIAGPMVETGQANGRGRGLHVYVAGDEATGETALEGVEVRGVGSYVVIPGSPHPSGVTYEWVNDLRPWTPEAMAPLPAALAPRRRERVVVDEGGRIPAGARDVTLTSLAGTMRARGMATAAIHAGLLVVNREQCDPPLPERQVAKIARSASAWELGGLPEVSAGGWLTGAPMDPAAVSPIPPPLLPGFPYMHRAMAAVISGPTGGGRSSLVQASTYDAVLAGLRVAYLGGEVTEGEFNDRAALLAKLRGDEITAELRAELARARWLDLGDVIEAAWRNPARWVGEAAAGFDVLIVDPLGDVLEALDLEDKASDYRKFYRRLIEPLRSAGAAVVMLDNIGHAEDAQHRPSGTAAKMHKADLLFSCAAVEEPSALRITATKVRAQRARIRKGDSWLFAEATQEIEPQGRQALIAAPRRTVRDDLRTARRGALLDALGDEPLSVRKAIERAGMIHGTLIPVGTAQALLSELKVTGKADQTTAGWVRCSSVQSLKETEHLNTPQLRLVDEEGGA
jgi:hypothetical protein